MPTAYSRSFDPDGARYGIPTYPWRMAPDGYATRRQLRALGLRPGGQPVAAQCMRINRRCDSPRVAYLYRVELARLVRPMTSRKWGALALAMRARRTCPRCRITYSYCLSTRHGICGPCLAADEQCAA